MARLLLERGAKVIIWDINTQGIDDVITEFNGFGEISGYTVDISDFGQVKTVAEQVKSEKGTVDILINNALLY